MGVSGSKTTERASSSSSSSTLKNDTDLVAAGVPIATGTAVGISTKPVAFPPSSSSLVTEEDAASSAPSISTSSSTTTTTTTATTPSVFSTTDYVRNRAKFGFNHERAVAWSHHLKTFVSGAGAGLCAAAVTSPLDVVRTRLAVQNTSSPTGKSRAYTRGLVDALRRIYREEGVRGYYRGFGTTSFVIPVFWAVYFTAYENCKHLMAFHFYEGVALTSQSAAVIHVVSAALSAALTDCVTNPLWVARTRQQTMHMAVEVGQPDPPYRTTFQTLKMIRQQEGIKSWYRGLSASLLGVSHVMIQFPLYERLKVELPYYTGTSTSSRGSDDGDTIPVTRIFSSSSTSSSEDDNQGGGGGGGGGESDTRSAPPMHPIDLLLASSISKAIASSITYPHEVLRARLQYSRSAFSGLRDCARQTVVNEGWTALYKGLSVNLVRVIPSCAMTFMSYEIFKAAEFNTSPSTSDDSSDDNDVVEK